MHFAAGCGIAFSREKYALREHQPTHIKKVHPIVKKIKQTGPRKKQ